MILLEDDPLLFKFISTKLNLSGSARIIEAPDIKEAVSPLTVELVIQDGNNTYLTQIKSKVSLDAIARMTLLKELLKKQEPGISHYSFVIAAKFIPKSAEHIAETVGINLVTVPRNIHLPVKNEKFRGRPRAKITSEKSWRVITRLLKEKKTSIRQLSLLEHVSYGWAHLIIQTLKNQDIVAMKDNYVTISNTDALLNGAAWERPFENLIEHEITINFDNAHTAATELSHILGQHEIRFAFTAYTAGGLYTGYAIRHDSVYLYLEKDEIDFFIQTFGEEEGEGIRARIYVPDRKLFNDSREIENIRVVSPAQTLLDLAGLGYSARDITKAMVEKYALL
ncbi:MAG: hypothetical protein SCH39_02640 [Methanosarcinales archaeon]|nr:hypothetical protein [Methanosarcinales archaeon]